jgi:Tol biopolymer transport system component
MRRGLLAAIAGTAMAAVGITHVTAQGGRPASLSQGPTVAVESQSGANPSVSGDGRFVVYAGPPTTAGDERASTVWLRDRSNGGEVELTRPVPGAPLGNSTLPVISGDGCYAAVLTEMPFDLFRDDNKGNRWDVYTMKLPGCGGLLDGWILVSTNAYRGEGGAADDVDPRDAPSISGSGSVIAYTHRFTDATPDLTGVIVVDITKTGQPGYSLPVAGTPTAPPNTNYRYLGLREPSVSDDGLFVAFTSDANSHKATPDWGTGPKPGGFANSQVFVWDRQATDQAKTVTRISLGPDSTANGDATQPSISADGTYIAFASTSVNLVTPASLPPCTNGCPSQIYRYNRTDDTVALVSRVPAGGDTTQVVGADLGASQPAINSDGSQVAFVTRSSNLLTTRPSVGGAASDGEILVSDVDHAQLHRASVLPDGVTPAPAANAHPKLSSTGRVVVFDTLAGADFSPQAAHVANSKRQVVGTTQEPQLTIADIDMGVVISGTPSAEYFVTLYNAGPSSFVPSKVESSNRDFAITFGACVDGYAIPPGGRCDVNVILTPGPGKVGPLSSVIKVSESGFGALSVESKFTGASGTPALRSDQKGYHHFDAMKVGESSTPNTFTISGNAATTITSVALQGANPKDFKIGKTNCRGATLDITAGCTIDVTFTPQAAGRLSATIIVSAEFGSVDAAGVATSFTSYTSISVDGSAKYAPTLEATATDVQAGGQIGLGGGGFAPKSTVTLLWADGAGGTSTVQTDANGKFLMIMPVAANERPGDRTLVAQTPGTGSDPASVLVRVTAQPVEELDASSPEWPGG